MGVIDLFSKRAARERGNLPDVFVYDSVPNHLRVQVIHILRDVFGQNDEAFRVLHDALRREYGLFELAGDEYQLWLERLTNFFLNAKKAEVALDVIELSFQLVEQLKENRMYQVKYEARQSPGAAIAELNQRFLEHGVGYAFESGMLMRKDSETLHVEVIKPALALLRDRSFAGANDEYMRAHEHYRHGRYKECLNECLKALESTLKTICKQKGWSFQPSDTAKKLIERCFAEKLIPDYLQSEFSGLRALLESGVPTVRNKAGGHGQGTDVVEVPAYLAAFLLHSAGAAIVMLVQASK